MEHPERPETVDERVDYIESLMERLVWRRGKTARELAKVWDLSASAIRDYSSEAHRRIVADGDEARRDITAGCSRLFRAAVEAGSAKDARLVGELWASVSGAKAPEKHQHGLLDATPEAAAAAVRATFGSHGAMKDNATPADGSGTDAPREVPGSAAES